MSSPRQCEHCGATWTPPPAGCPLGCDSTAERAQVSLSASPPPPALACNDDGPDHSRIGYLTVAYGLLAPLITSGWMHLFYLALDQPSVRGILAGSPGPAQSVGLWMVALLPLAPCAYLGIRACMLGTREHRPWMLKAGRLALAAALPLSLYAVLAAWGQRM